MNCLSSPKLMKSLVFLITILFLFSCHKTKSSSNKTIEEIDKWYYNSECIDQGIDSTGTVFNRSVKEKEFMVFLVKTGLNLDDKWTLIHQQLKLTKITDIEYIIIVETFFQNVKEDKDITLHTKMYYFDLESNFPIPIKEQTFQTLSGKSQFKNERSLWMGDYNEYMKYYFCLEMKNLDTIH